MKYLEIAIGTPANRGVLIPKGELASYLDGQPLYRSVYLYDESAAEYVAEKGSLKNFFGVRYIDKIPIDVDKKDNSDEKTLDILRGIVYELEESDIGCGSFQCYFSGSGYHIMLAGELFNFKPSSDLPYVVKQTMRKVNPDIDLSIYMRTGIYRLQHSLNQKTGLNKIPLTNSEVMNLEPKDIFELAKGRRLDFEYTNLEASGDLKHLVVEDIPDVKVLTNVSEPTKMTPCVQSMLNKGPSSGNRHLTALRIASHYKRHGIPSHYAKVSLLHWNNKSLDENHINELVENVYNRNYQYGCQDSIMLEHCKTQCIFFKRKDYLVDVKTSDEMQGELHDRLTTDFSGKTIDLGAMLGLDVESVIYPGELVTIFGPTGSNKTTFASSWYIHRRHLQIVSGMEKMDVNENYQELYDHHKDELEHVMIQTVSPTLNTIADKVRELQPAVVVIDYIDLVDTPGSYRGEYEKIKYISHGLSNMAVNNDMIVIQISQVSREYSRNEVLDLYAGKGSGAIENASRKVIGLNGQSKSPVRNVKLFKNTDGELFETTVKWTPSFRLRRTE